MDCQGDCTAYSDMCMMWFSGDTFYIEVFLVIMQVQVYFKDNHTVIVGVVQSIQTWS